MSTDAWPKHRLRVLSGRHAGAEVLLQACNTLSASRSSDLQLQDWLGAEIRIVRLDGESVCWSESATPPYSQSAHAWDNWSPMRLGGVVMAHGPDGPWPADEWLWSRWLAAQAPEAAQNQTRWLKPVLGGTVALACLGVLGAAAWHWARAEASTASSLPEQLAAEVERLPKQRMNLKLSQDSPARLSGWVAQPSDRGEVLQLLARYVALPVVQEFQVLSEVQQALSTALGSGVRVESSGNAQFVLTGQVRNLTETRALLSRTLSELGLPASQVVDRLSATDGHSRALSGTSLRTDSLRYEQQSDGSLWIQLKPWKSNNPDADQRGEAP